MIRNRQSAILLPLLLEVGCEEIPARFLRDAEKGLGERVLAAVREARLLPDSSDAAMPAGVAQSPITNRQSPISTYSTPRRLVVNVAALLKQQPDKVEEILGPPVKVAIDAAGKYTRAAESFAQKNSVGVEHLARTMTPKGEYLSLRKTTLGPPGNRGSGGNPARRHPGSDLSQEHVLDGQVGAALRAAHSLGRLPAW